MHQKLLLDRIIDCDEFKEDQTRKRESLKSRLQFGSSCSKDKMFSQEIQFEKQHQGTPGTPKEPESTRKAALCAVTVCHKHT